MPSCCIPKCSSRTTKGKKIYMASFPSDPERRKLWIINIGKINWNSTKYLFVCEIHFAAEMWEKNRVDGKQKLKCNAVPTIFPARSDQTNESLEEQPDITFETLSQTSVQENISEEQNDYLTLDVPDVTPLLLNSSTSNYFEKESNGKIDEVKWLKKQLEEANKKLDLANKIILKSNRCNFQLKKHVRRLTRMQNNSKTQNLESSLKLLFNDDQIKVIANQSSRGCLWSNDTIKKAFRLKFFCGSSGYQELLNQKIPLPSERTLRKIGKKLMRNMILNGVAAKSGISKMFIRNVRKIQYMYNAPLLRKSFGTNQSLAEYNKAFEKFKLKQAKMQCDDGLPVYLKCGVRDKILFNITVAMVLINTIQSIYTIKQFLKM